MGREIRRVPPNWEHPKTENGSYHPMFDESYAETLKNWKWSNESWKKGEYPDQKDGSGKDCESYAEWAGEAPEPEYYRPEWKKDQATWWQVYETVSEGTPVSPPFETQKELVDYLVKNGDFWDQSRREEALRQVAQTGGFKSMPCAPWKREQAEKFVYGDGFAFTGVVVNGVYKSGIDAL